MAKMIDRLLTGTLTATGWQKQTNTREEWLSYESLIKECLLASHVIVASNVARYMYVDTDQENWDIKRDFPCLAPPFATFWIEWKQPSISVSKEKGILRKGECDGPWIYSGGVLFTATDLRDSSHITADSVAQQTDVLLKRNGAAIQSKYAMYGSEFIKHLNPDERMTVNVMQLKAKLDQGEDVVWDNVGRWSLEARVFMEVEKHGAIINPSCWRLLIDAQGNVIDEQWGMVVGMHSTDRSVLEPWLDDVSGSAPAFFPAFLALSFMHCKNVKTIDNVPDSKLARAYQKRHGSPMLKYYTLEIDPMKQVLRNEGQCAEVGLKRALHICRGHFKDYRERGLFGKKRGIFWWDNHVRGHLHEGVVLKDYEVKSHEQ